jgi:hypothetical protein
LERWLNAIRGELGGEVGALGYPNAIEAKEAKTAQIAAQSPSDKSDMTIRWAPASGRS